MEENSNEINFGMKIMSPDIDSYIPSEEQLKQLEILGNLVNQCRQKEVDVCVVGGYGVDALYGKLTRDHGDVDLIVENGKKTEIENILKQMSFVRDLNNKDDKKVVYRAGDDLNLSKDFKIEFGEMNSYEGFFSGEKTLGSFVPKENNGSLGGFLLKTLTLEGQKTVSEIQKTRALKEGWSDYRHEENFNKVIAAVESRNK